MFIVSILIQCIQIVFLRGQIKMGISLSQDSRTATHTNIQLRKCISMGGEKLTIVNWANKGLHYRAAVENCCVVVFCEKQHGNNLYSQIPFQGQSLSPLEGIPADT